MTRPLVKYAAAILLATTGMVRAAQYFWDGGNGTWNTSTANWRADSASGTFTNWPVDDATAEAVFTNSPCTISLSGSINAGRLTFQTPGWSITSGTLVMKGARTISMDNQTSSIYASIQGTSGLIINGNGALRIGTNNTYTGGTAITNATVLIDNPPANMITTLGASSNENLTLNNATVVISSAPASISCFWNITVEGSGTTFQTTIPNANYHVLFKSPNQFHGTGTLTLMSAMGYTSGFGFSATNCLAAFGGKYVLNGLDSTKYMRIFGLNDVLGTATGDDVICITNYVEYNYSTSSGTNIVGTSTQGIYVGTNSVLRLTQTPSDTKTVSVPAKISGPGAVVFLPKDDGDSMHIVSNTNNCWTGNTSFRGGVSTDYGFVRLGADEVIPHGPGKGTVLFDYQNAGGHGRLDLNGKTETINGLSSSITNAEIMNLSTNAANLIIGADNGTATYAGMINHSNGLINITKTGTGTQVFSGTNTYEGTTAVSNGVLRLMHNMCLSTNAIVCIGPGATNDLPFTGTNIIRRLYVNDRHLEPGIYGSNSFPDSITGPGCYLSTEGPIPIGTVVFIR